MEESFKRKSKTCLKCDEILSFVPSNLSENQFDLKFKCRDCKQDKLLEEGYWSCKVHKNEVSSKLCRHCYRDVEKEIKKGLFDVFQRDIGDPDKVLCSSYNFVFSDNLIVKTPKNEGVKRKCLDCKKLLPIYQLYACECTFEWLC